MCGFKCTLLDGSLLCSSGPLQKGCYPVIPPFEVDPPIGKFTESKFEIRCKPGTIDATVDVAVLGIGALRVGHKVYVVICIKYERGILHRLDPVTALLDLC
ncbi:hypothetical protein SDC9_180438 [bioreactor metagenome]|uniref:Uncharacterized protein n=1 Tax=bioreactor metagenome TaxID=1076179 RepID=A0A645H1Q7_9ZZZZ